MLSSVLSCAVRLLPGVALACALLGAGSASAEIKDFRDWTAACDNLRNCNAYGFDIDARGSAFIRLERGGGADAQLRISIAIDVQDGSSFELSFDDPGLGGLPPQAVTGAKNDEDDYKRLVISNPQVVEPMLAGLRKAAKLIITRIDPPGATPSDPGTTEISLSGIAAAMLWMDEQQKRVGTVTALIGRGEKPASAVPAPPAAPIVTAAKLSTAPVPEKPPAAVFAKARQVCETKKRFTEAENITRLTGEEVMYWFPCKELSGAYNFFYALVIAAPGKPLRIAEFKLPREVDGQKAGNVETNINPGLDDETQTLNMFNKGRGLGDCGTTSDWVWDGATFRMISYQTMPTCKGVPMRDWPTLFRAERK
jgi:hypothetical protein